MRYSIVFWLVFVFTITPLFSYFTQDYITDNFSLDGFYSAFLVHLAIIYTSIVLTLWWCKKKKLGWQKNQYIDLNHVLVMQSIAKMITLFAIIFFVFYGRLIFSGLHRGNIRVGVGGVGWLVTYVSLYGTFSLMSLTCIYYFYLSPQKKKIKKYFYYIISIGILMGLMKGGKINVVYIMLPILLQCGELLNVKKLIAIGILGVLSIILIGTKQMDMSFSQSITYNIYRATNLELFGSFCAWDKYPRGANKPYLTFINASLGENLTAAIFGIDRHSREFLNYSVSRKLTYDYYGDSEGAVAGTTNITITPVGEGVFWFGRKFYFIVSILGALTISIIIRKLFLTMRGNMLLKNVMFTNLYLIFVLWCVASNGSIISQYFGLVTFIYLSLAYLTLRIILSKSKIVKL